MAVNLINSEEIEVSQIGSDIQLELTGKTGDLVVDSIRTKNIFDGLLEQGSFLPDTGVPVSSTTRIRSASFTNVKAGNYTISLYNNNNFDVAVYVYDIDGTWKSSESITGWQSLPYTINILGERKIKIAIRNKNNSTIVPSDVQNIQIEEGNTATTYTPYQNLDLKTPVVLYNNQNGTQDASITLSDNIGNYEYIEIYYRSSWIYGSLKIYTNKSNTSKSFPLNIIYGSGTADITFMVNVYAIANNKITIADSGNRGMNGYISNENIVSITRQNPIYILRVVGYR